MPITHHQTVRMARDHQYRQPMLIAVVLAATALFGGACSSDDGASGEGAGESGATTAPTRGDVESGSAGVFPGDDWQTIDAEAAGLDQAVLDEIADDAETGLSNCWLVVRGGRIVDERYFRGTRADSAQEVFSASKSFTSVLMGMAADEGSFSVGDRASQWIPQWQGGESEDITIEQLLNNTSGRFQDFETDYVEMAARAPDKTAFSIGLGQQSEPGTEWVYNNAAIQTLEAVFGESTGQDLSDFAQERLFEPLGMDDSSLIRDAAGNPLTFMGVQSTCRDMARFGLLALRQGNWDGQQIVSEDWMQSSTGRSSQELNAAYGWLWWLNREGTITGGDQATGGSEEGEVGRLVEGAPAEMFFALGLGGQMIAIDPGSDTVVVRLGDATYPDGTEKFERSDIVRVATEAVL